MRATLMVTLFFGFQVIGWAQAYTIEELPSPPPTNANIYPNVLGLQDRGHLLGNTFNLTNYAYGNFTFEDGGWRSVMLTNYEYHVWAVNKSGTVLGNIYEFLAQPYRIRPFIWRDGAIQELHFSTNNYVVGKSINDKGVIVGHFSAFQLPSLTRPFLYQNEQFQTLDTPEADFATADVINNRGAILINAQKSARYWALLREPDGTYREIGTLAGGQTVCNGLNDRGTVVGVSTLVPYNQHRAIIYRHGAFSELGLPANIYSVALHINNHDEVLGEWWRSTNGAPGGKPFLYRDGIFQDLNELAQRVTGNDDWEILTTAGINDRGDIAGMANHHGLRVPYLLKRIHRREGPSE